jgi:hypothetical protein
MKQFFLVVVAFVGLSVTGCQDSKEDSKNTPSDISFYRNVGKEIPFDLGMRWMEAYKKKQLTSGKVASLNFALTATQLNLVLQSVPNLTGVAFHYATDGLGATHILAIPVDESLSLWSTIPGRVYVDTNTGLQLTQATAEQWAQNYKNAHAGEIWFHFFGQNVFQEITSLSFFNSVDIEPAFNDQELTPELLLIVWNTVLGITGRGKEDSGRVYDASNPCPPCAVQ